MDRLVKVIDGLEPERVAQILCIRVYADEHNGNLRQKGSRLPRQLNAVHMRHSDIGQQDIGLEVLKLTERFLPVACVAHDLDAKRLPVDQLPQPLARLPFVIHDQQGIHGFHSRLSFGFQY